MEMRLPGERSEEEHQYKVNTQRHHTKPGWKRTKGVVVAADGLLVATVPCQLSSIWERRLGESLPSIAGADANDGNGGTGEAHEGVDVLYDDPDGGEDFGGGWVARLLDGLAALDGTGGAGVSSGPVSGSRGGDSKDCEGGDGEEFGEHGECR